MAVSFHLQTLNMLPNGRVFDLVVTSDLSKRLPADLNIRQYIVVSRPRIDVIFYHLSNYVGCGAFGYTVPPNFPDSIGNTVPGPRVPWLYKTNQPVSQAS